MFQDLRTDLFHDSEKTRSAKIFNMIQAIRTDVELERDATKVLDKEILSIAEALVQEIKQKINAKEGINL